MNRFDEPLRPTWLDRAAQLLSLAVGVQILQLAIPKLAAEPWMIQGFAQLGAGLGVDGELLRMVTGTTEALAGLSLLLAVGAFVNRGRVFFRSATALGHGLMLGLMVGALATEFIVRPGQQPGLVQLAVTLLAASAIGAAWVVRRFGLPGRKRVTTTAFA